MYKIGVVPGKFTPPHLGHLKSIIIAATRCEKLYVVVSDNPKLTKKLCEENHLPLMDGKMRTKWLSQELQCFPHIKVLYLDENETPSFPEGWTAWALLLRKLIPEKIDVIFGGEKEYQIHHERVFPDIHYEIIPRKTGEEDINATQIRKNPIKYWDQIIPSARPHFAKKILITGTESCGKTTITKYLAKIYNTASAEEEGRYYSARHLGGNESVFTIRDFELIVYQQYLAEEKALTQANRVVFFDTDAGVTQFYAEMYINQTSDLIEKFVDPQRYDLVLFFKPDVKWVDDGLRWNHQADLRQQLDKKLRLMYEERGFNTKIVNIEGNYEQRLIKCCQVVENLLNK
jgi:HTH-type transcriptional repressor of NAD biosynthesis genes